MNRTVHESKTIEWLGRRGGTWKNGWYEDLTGKQWYSDLIRTNPSRANGIGSRGFNMLQKVEIRCQNETECTPSESVDQACF